ncbi:ISAs1 family transposase [Rhizobium leucaenae]|uniref:Transposase n=7 Tax=Rhizobiaceae TaxID=82115 RepID=D2JTN5_9HYPH|nr:ISAs1 family transposase [Rhizobium leucaenae]AAM55009.1 probable insertion sequence transposase protein [Rhizobium etli CFN 42]ACZ99269.1 transposase [Rhizobium etli bv. phaseoli]ACZ99304.1 transposase [Rhizobium giardinii]ACZ99305.1 transposase [Rhizobium gallicum]ACZ99307.1 transposase [Rhizobium leguminosarum]ACZ99308.1 transposase [Sinorhizobium fredii GR64]APO77361.1 ISAs1 family insertion sequence transposase protein [Rhizobium etli 8C-3]ARQ60578.1 ISAs1 family insertion sequence 
MPPVLKICPTLGAQHTSSADVDPVHCHCRDRLRRRKLRRHGRFGVSKKKWLKTIVPLPYGIAGHGTFSTVFRCLNQVAFEAALPKPLQRAWKAWWRSTARRYEATPLPLVKVWAAGCGLVIGQQTAPGRNEVQGALDALALLSLEGAIVTADALHCRADTAHAILSAGGDYALALKANQPGLLAQTIARLDDVEPLGVQTAAENDHDRCERRRACIVAVNDIDFPGLQAIGSVEATSRHADGRLTSHVRYFLLSTVMSAAALIEVTRTHWQIENKLHWVLDVQFREDAARNRKDHGPANIALLRKIALNLIRAHPDKASIRRKIKKAGWDDQFLISIIAHMR